MPDETPSPEQFIENLQGWEPAPDLPDVLKKTLEEGGVTPLRSGELAGALSECAGETFRYIRLIHEYATTKELGKESFLPAVAELAQHLQRLKETGDRYAAVFRVFDEQDRPNLKTGEIDTRYYDVIAGMDLEEFLWGVLDRVTPLLAAMSLTSRELQGARPKDVYILCVRFHLYLRYLSGLQRPVHEETWSVLFDMFGLFSGNEEGSLDPLLGDLDALKLELERLKRSN